jgi:replicative DNA helicase
MTYLPTQQILATEIDNIVKRVSKGSIGFPSGYPSLNASLMGGFMEGYLYCIGGLASMGKTMVALNIVVKQLIELSPNEVLVFVSTHTSSPVVMQKLLAIGLEIELRKIQNGNLSKEELALLVQHPFINKLKSNQLVIIENNKPTVENIKVSLEALIVEGKAPKMLYIDQIQDMQIPETGMNREQTIYSLLKSLKVLAAQYKVPVLYTSKVSKRVLYRKGNQVPQIDDLLDSRLFGMVTEYIFMVWRPMYYQAIGADDLDTQTEELHLVCRKNENLPLDVMILETNLRKHTILTKPMYEIDY